MEVLNVNGPFPAIVRLSVALSCRTRPLLPLIRPETAPPIVKGPPTGPGPGFVLEPVFLKLQPTRSAEVINNARIAKERDFMVGFMIDCRLLQSVANNLLYNDAKHSLHPVAFQSITQGPG
jgi:hypothetical protein